MIYRLQHKFIIISTISVLAVVSLVFCIIFLLNYSLMNKNIDILADGLSDGGGRFPSYFIDVPNRRPFSHKDEENFDFITPETPFSTRHFTVLFDKTGRVTKTFTESIYMIDADLAIEYAREVLKDDDERGWISNYRYKVFEFEIGYGVVFVDGSVNLSALKQSMLISGAVLLGCGALVLIMIFLLSKRAVKPIAESYEKQKQFITDANHELKTPLTLILTNIDIAESELGQNEWLDDIRLEGQRMTELVNQLVALSRMDEEKHNLNISKIPFGKIVADSVSEFEQLASARGKKLSANVNSDVVYFGDEELLRKLVGILLDNAIKYCDYNGEIVVSLHHKKRIELIVDNTYTAINDIELNRLFDRFYRSDKARTFNGGYGIGLSLAKSIVEKHNGEIIALKKDSKHIRFRVSF